MEDQNESEAATELDPRDDLICTLLADGWRHGRIGVKIGVSTKTIQRLLAVPEFSAELTRRRSAAVAATTAGLENLGAAALGALEELLNSDDDRVRLRAIELVLNVGRRFRQEDLLEQQLLARLEAVESKTGIGRTAGGGA